MSWIAFNWVTICNMIASVGLVDEHDKGRARVEPEPATIPTAWIDFRVESLPDETMNCPKIQPTHYYQGYKTDSNLYTTWTQNIRETLPVFAVFLWVPIQTQQPCGAENKKWTDCLSPRKVLKTVASYIIPIFRYIKFYDLCLMIILPHLTWFWKDQRSLVMQGFFV